METAVVRRVQFPVFTGMILRRGEEIHYIGGADVLPAPLDIQTETLMIEKLQTDEFEEAKASLIDCVRTHRGSFFLRHVPQR